MVVGYLNTDDINGLQGRLAVLISSQLDLSFYFSISAFLLNVHVQVDEVDEEGWSPLIHACVLGKAQAALTLIDNGAQLDLKVNQTGFLNQSIISLSLSLLNTNIL